jgi:hypothetical protein
MRLHYDLKSFRTYFYPSHEVCGLKFQQNLTDENSINSNGQKYPIQWH